MSSIDNFIERAERICEKSRKAPALMLKAQKEGRALLRQFEKYLIAKGLGVPTRTKQGLRAQHHSR